MLPFLWAVTSTNTTWVKTEFASYAFTCSSSFKWCLYIQGEQGVGVGECPKPSTPQGFLLSHCAISLFKVTVYTLSSVFSSQLMSLLFYVRHPSTYTSFETL